MWKEQLSCHVTTWQKVWNEQDQRRRNKWKKACGTCEEISPLLFLCLPKTQITSTKMLGTLLWIRNICNIFTNE